MRRQFVAVWALALLLVPAALAAVNPLVGRWDFTNTSESGVQPNWLSVAEKGGKLEVWFQPSGGHVTRVREATANGSHLSLKVSEATADGQATTWELDAAAGKLMGEQHRGEKTHALVGVPAPALKRNPPKAWTAPEPLFNGRDLSGWEPIGSAANSHWGLKDGLLVNSEHGANLKTTRTFEDFRLHFEVKCPDDANSGFYLRGRYEIQLEYVQEGTEPPERGMGSVYGRLAPRVKLPRTPAEWESFDVTLVGRVVTIRRNGVIIIDKKEIEGITGGALDAREGDPGPFYIQGDHTGGLAFRNITVSTPRP